MRDGARHLLVEDGREIITAAGEEVAIGGAAFFLEGVLDLLAEASGLLEEKRLGLGLVLGVIQGDGDELEVAHVELTGDLDEVRELLDARRAPGGPDIDHAVLVGGVGTQVGDAGLIDQFDGDRGLGPGLVLDVVQGLLLAPLGGAAHGLGEFEFDFLTGEDGVHGVLAILGLHGAVVIEAGVVEAALVAELEILIEDEDVRSREATVGAGDRLGVAVVKVVKGPLVLFSVGLHLGIRVAVLTVTELILAEAVRVVGVDREKLHALTLVFFVELLEAALDAVRGRAVVRREEYDERFAAGVFGELVLLAVGAEQLEVRSGIAALERADIGRVTVDQTRGIGGADADNGGQDGEEGH